MPDQVGHDTPRHPRTDHYVTLDSDRGPLHITLGPDRGPLHVTLGYDRGSAAAIPSRCLL